MSLKKKLVRLAYEKKELRPHLLPIIKEAQEDEPRVSILPFDTSFAVPLRAGLEDLAEAGKAFKKRLQATMNAYKDSVPFIETFVRDAENHLAQALFKVKRVLRKQLPDTEAAIAEATSGYRMAGARDWFSRYMRIFHPVITGIYRWIKGPVHPEPLQEFANLQKACQALVDSSDTLVNLVVEATKKSKFFFQGASVKRVVNNLAFLEEGLDGVTESFEEAKDSIGGIMHTLKHGPLAPESWMAV